MGYQNNGRGGGTNRSPSDREKFEQAVDMAERLAVRNAELEAELSRRQVAALNAEKARPKPLADDLKAAGSPAARRQVLDGRLARIADKIRGVKLSDPDRYGGLTVSERARIDDANRRANR